MTRAGRSTWLALALACSAFAAPATAQDDASRSAARRMATTGVEAFQHEDYATAVDKLQRAYQMLPVPSVGLWLARALVKQGHFVAASERYVEVGRLPVTQGDAAVQESAKKDAVTESDALAPKIPSVVITLQGAAAQDVQLSVDGAPLSPAFVGEERPVDPGKHHIEGHRGAQLVAADVTLNPGEKQSVTLKFEAVASSSAPAAAAPPGVASAAPADVSSKSAGSSRRVLAWSAIGLGAAGIVTGSVAGVLAISKKGKLDDSGDCEAHQCLRSTMQSDLDSYGTLRTVSSIGFIAGGVLAAAGVVLLVTDRSSSQPAAAQNAFKLRVGASGVSAEGTF